MGLSHGTGCPSSSGMNVRDPHWYVCTAFFILAIVFMSGSCIKKFHDFCEHAD
jgi:hypothetical protein